MEITQKMLNSWYNHKSNKELFIEQQGKEEDERQTFEKRQAEADDADRSEREELERLDS